MSEHHGPGSARPAGGAADAARPRPVAGARRRGPSARPVGLPHPQLLGDLDGPRRPRSTAAARSCDRASVRPRRRPSRAMPGSPPSPAIAQRGQHDRRRRPAARRAATSAATAADQRRTGVTGIRTRSSPVDDAVDVVDHGAEHVAATSSQPGRASAGRRRRTPATRRRAEQAQRGVVRAQPLDVAQDGAGQAEGADADDRRPAGSAPRRLGRGLDDQPAGGGREGHAGRRGERTDARC